MNANHSGAHLLPANELECRISRSQMGFPRESANKLRIFIPHPVGAASSSYIMSSTFCQKNRKIKPSKQQTKSVTSVFGVTFTFCSSSGRGGGNIGAATATSRATHILQLQQQQQSHDICSVPNCRHSMSLPAWWLMQLNVISESETSLSARVACLKARSLYPKPIHNNFSKDQFDLLSKFSSLKIKLII